MRLRGHRCAAPSLITLLLCSRLAERGNGIPQRGSPARWLRASLGVLWEALEATDVVGDIQEIMQTRSLVGPGPASRRARGGQGLGGWTNVN